MQVFRECILRDSEFLCVELTAYDRSGALLGVLFEGVARYGVLKRAYEADVSISCQLWITRRYTTDCFSVMMIRRLFKKVFSIRTILIILEVGDTSSCFC